MDGLIISELARRSGVPPTTLRFYDQQGLLPARRSPAGYRLYDDSAVGRLAFITTAKSLGPQLPEIRQRLRTWQDGLCAQVQGELGPLLAQWIGQTGSGSPSCRPSPRVFARRRSSCRASTATVRATPPAPS